jgi:hypothetical protein
MTQTATDGPEHEGTERFEVIEGGHNDPEFVYFDTAPEDLPDVKDLQISQFRISAMDSAEDFNVGEIATFITGASEGRMDRGVFQDRFERALIELVESKNSAELTSKLNTMLLDHYDEIDEQHPRLMPILDRFRNEGILMTDHFVMVNKLCMLLAIIE